MHLDAQPPPEAQLSPQRPLLIAPWWHTAILIVVLLSASITGTQGRHPLAATYGSKVPEYLWNMFWEWVLLGFVWLGTRKRIRLRELIGGRWASWEELFLDIAYAAVFWVASLIVLGVCAKLMHLDQAGKIDAMRKQLEFLVPVSKLELTLWFCLSTTAGFCEEIIFRGYLQRQLGLMSGSALLGVVISAVVFGASHGYEGVARMILIAVYGLLFGLLAWWRKSLRPGMIAHAWHDALSGAVLRVLK